MKNLATKVTNLGYTCTRTTRYVQDTLRLHTKREHQRHTIWWNQAMKPQKQYYQGYK